MSRAVPHSILDEHLPGGEVLAAAFFARGSDEVAADLIGKIVWRLGFGGGRLTEVEAYLPREDPASHARPGRTRRNAAMFGPPGHLYVFLSYGVHRLLNFVCDREGVGSAVLLRSYEPLSATGEAVSSPGAVGPGVVGRTLGVRLDMSGLALGGASGVFVIDDGARPKVGRAARVGISRGAELPLRYYMIDSRCFSGPAPMIEEGPE
jgi:DNA-3-methyladenine glycosylase